MNYTKQKVSVVIPTLNEEHNLKVLLKKIPSFVYEIIIVDGYSEDKTVSVAKKHSCKVIFDSEGKGSALIKGLKEAKGDMIILIDADCSQLPSEFPILIGGILAGYDICMGSRFLLGGGTTDMPWYRKLGNKFFVTLVNIIWKSSCTDLCYGYRCVKKKVVNKLNLSVSSFGIETEITIHAIKNKLKILEVPSFEKKRLFGYGKLKTFKDGYLILKVIISEIFKR